MLASAEQRVLNGNPPAGAARIGLGGLFPELFVAGEAEGLFLYQGPVYILRGPGGGGMLGDVHFVQFLIADPVREFVIPGHHGVLPGNGFVPYVRVLVVVSFLHNAVIHRVVQQVQATFQEDLVLLIVFGKEPYVVVCGGDVHAVGLGAVNVLQGLLHVLHRVGVFQLFPQPDHAVLEPLVGESAEVVLRQHRLAASCEQADRHQKNESFHNASIFCKTGETYPCNE